MLFYLAQNIKNIGKKCLCKRGIKRAPQRKIATEAKPMTSPITSPSTAPRQVSKIQPTTTQNRMNGNKMERNSYLFGIWISGDDSMLEESFLLRCLASLFETTIFTRTDFSKCLLLLFFFSRYFFFLTEFLFALFNGFYFHFLPGKFTEFALIVTCKLVNND